MTGFLAVVMFGSGCGTSAEDCHNTRTCPPPPDAGVTVIYVPSDAGDDCDGVCASIPSAGVGWSPPFVSWSGPTSQLPEPSQRCPSNARVSSDPFWSAPVQTMTCPACSCAPPTGVCALPDTVTVSASPQCATDMGDAGVPFNPPSDWDGGCTTNDAIANLECDGGVCSAAVEPLIPIGNCVPIQTAIPKAVTWGVAAYTCTGATNGGSCKDSSEVCTPAPPAGFTICISRQGNDLNIKCPPAYPVRSVFYLSADDDRGCAPCECGPPEGSSCYSLVSLYADGACAMQVGSVTALSSSAVCVDVPAGSLGSKQASAPTYTPGSCTPTGGGVTGSVEPKDPFTFCCEQ